MKFNYFLHYHTSELLSYLANRYYGPTVCANLDRTINDENLDGYHDAVCKMFRERDKLKPARYGLPFDDVLFCGTVFSQDREAALHHLLDEAISHRSGIQQSVCYPVDVDQQEDDESEKQIMRIWQQIGIALGCVKPGETT